MSGKDERRLLKIPTCPICGYHPEYWTVLNNFKRCLGWLLSDEYKKENNVSHHVLIAKFGGILDFKEFTMRIENVQCSWDFDHTFEIGSDTFSKVRNALQLYHSKEGFRSH